MTVYEPSFYSPHVTAAMPNVPSAWSGLEQILPAIIKDFNLRTDLALEFGVDYSFSTAALASQFKNVIGVDLFTGDAHAGYRHTQVEAQKALRDFPNATLVRSDYRDWIEYKQARHDLIHIDIVHTYEDTFACGEWSIGNSECVIFHDTESFMDVRRAVEDLAGKYNRTFYNYPKCHGLAILREGM